MKIELLDIVKKLHYIVVSGIIEKGLKFCQKCQVLIMGKNACDWYLKIALKNS